MNSTSLQQPLWHSYGAIATEVVSCIIYCVISVAVMAIIIGRNIIPSIVHTCVSSVMKKKLKRQQRVYSIRASDFNIASVCNRQEIPLVSIFFLFFYLYTLYRVWTSICMLVGLATRVATNESFASLIVFTIMNGFDYTGFVFFLAYFCFYIILLSHVATIWFTIIDLGNIWRRRVFLSFVGVTIAICFFIGGILCWLAIIAGLVVYVFDQVQFYYIVAGVAVAHVGSHVVLTIMASGIILFIIIMVIKYGSKESARNDDDDTISKLRIYSAKLVLAIGILFLANVFRISGAIMLVFDEIPIFVPTITSRILPDVLDMSICIIIYWPFPLGFGCEFRNYQTLRKILAPMNFVGLYDKKGNISTQKNGVEMESVPSTPSDSTQNLEQMCPEESNTISKQSETSV